MNIKNTLIKIRFYTNLFFLSHFGWVWTVLSWIPPVKRYINYTVIKHYSDTFNFPLQYSTLSPYTTVDSLTDTSYYVRLLPEKTMSYPKESVNDIVDKLFLRKGAESKLDYKYSKSSVLLISFAQFLIDQIIITDEVDKRKQLGNNRIDLSTVYGDTPEYTHLLRTHKGGKLKTQIINGEEYPLYYKDNPVPVSDRITKTFPPGTDINKLFVIGRLRLHVTRGPLTFVILFMREHNRIADLLSKAHRDWDDERLFQTARNTNVAQFMKMVFEDYIADHIASLFKFRLKFMPEIFTFNTMSYDNSRITVEFNYLYRWHMMIPNQVKVKGKYENFFDVTWNTSNIVDNGLSSTLTDLSTSSASHLGLFNTPAVMTQLDISTINESRLNKLGSYNEYRDAMGLWTVTTFEEITSDVATQKALREVYTHVDNVEFYPGLIAEQTISPNSSVPLLMSSILVVQALQGILGNPLLSPNVYKPETFDQIGWDIIQQASLKQLVKDNVTGNPVVSFSI